MTRRPKRDQRDEQIEKLAAARVRLISEVDVLRAKNLRLQQQVEALTETLAARSHHGQRDLVRTRAAARRR